MAEDFILEDQDEMLPKRIFEEEQKEIEQEVAAAVLKKKKAISKKIVTKHTKDTEYRKKFVNFLKACGYNRKQLGPMKFQNLLFLYESEKKKLREREERRRYEEERLIKAAHDVGATVVDPETGKERRSKNKEDIHPSHGVPASPTTVKTKRKQVARTGPKHKKAKITSPVNTASSTTESVSTADPVSTAEPSRTAADEDIFQTQVKIKQVDCSLRRARS